MTDRISQQPTTPLQTIKVLFGDKDWMRGHEPASRKEMQAIETKCGIKSAVHVIPQAGHHLYIDNAPAFGRHILDD